MARHDSAAPPVVSVVMTVYKPHPEYFPEAVRSILDQTLDEMEVIVVEDPSPRSGRAMLADVRDDRLRYFENAERTSLIRQKNLGLAQARGDFVAIFDADDIAERHRLRTQVDFLHQHPEVDLVGSQIALIDGRGALCGYRHFPTQHQQIVGALRRVVPISHPTVMIRRGTLLRAGGYRYDTYPVAEDYELWSRLVQQGARFANHPEALVRYRIHPGQMKATHLRDTIRGVLDVKRRYWLDQMDWGSRLRMWAERLLLCVPPWLVLRLLMLVEYRERTPPPAPAATPAPLAAADGALCRV